MKSRSSKVCRFLRSSWVRLAGQDDSACAVAAGSPRGSWPLVPYRGEDEGAQGGGARALPDGTAVDHVELLV
ncbi:hypothetical protein [Streptomyces yangpuensis]|uniref:hypothetical protein n=1 Tax=Streptomyces yangpuensis TaxID=1648182 RepID=UPI0036C159AA